MHHIGLAKDRGGHVVTQPRLSLFDKRWEQQLEMK